ncbi:YhjD/YihY/BrkB family envelope integrity protein [Agrobacterium cavarae]|uniref:YhjD/YihY/BrkB family envelope integrity protein n=1 Tax=Agrobacterium cavarae TaxID=2528239 RepID=UPI001FDF7FE0|nr:YhjD/YihY/BrkB family envelope integrity protein [Agrobacterium cavarae]
MITVLCLVVSVLFPFHLENFANCNATYGTLGALNGQMVWVSILVIVLIVGAEINA